MGRSNPRCQLHPFVDLFVHTEKTVQGILRERPDFRGPIFDAMRALANAGSQKGEQHEAICSAEQVSLDDEDPFLVVLFAFAWAMVARRAGRLAEASALIQRAKTLLARDSLPELEAQILNAEAQVAMAVGDKRGADEFYRRILQVVPPDSPKRASCIVEYGLFLAMLWRQREIDQAIEEVEKLAPARHVVSRICQVRFVQFAETGQVAEALRWFRTVEQYNFPGGTNTSQVVFWRALFCLMQGTPPPSDAEPDTIRPLAMLLTRRPEDALNVVKKNLSSILDQFLAASVFPSFNLVRAELACGHADAARRVMDIRCRRGNVHPLDDFFMARVELLSGNRELAAELFTKALQTVDRYSARGRLEFELRMSCELSPADMLWLTSTPAAAEARASVGADGSVAASLGAYAAPELRGVARLLGPSAEMRSVREAVKRFSALDVPVLITGETGTGKELVARALHEESGRRARPFVAVNCGAISDSLLESELFGHERGAFTGAARAHRGLFEQAGKGTIFLDEIGEISPRLQVALLRVLESDEIRPVGGTRSRRVGCRFVAATNAPLDRLTAEGRFRKDLLYRLQRLEIRIAPLRERRDDIVPLVEHFLVEGRNDGLCPRMSSELRSELRRRDWPGNVRELRNVIERMRLLGSEGLSYGANDLVPEPADTREDSRFAAGADEAQHSTEPAPQTPETPRTKLAEALAASRSPLRRLERLREAFRQSPTLTRQEVMRYLGVSHATATYDLAALVAEGFIEKVKPTASPRTHYFRLKAPPVTPPMS